MPSLRPFNWNCYRYSHRKVRKQFPPHNKEITKSWKYLSMIYPIEAAESFVVIGQDIYAFKQFSYPI